MAIDSVESRGVCDSVCSVPRERGGCGVDCCCGTVHQHSCDNHSGALGREDPTGTNSPFRMSPKVCNSSIRVRIERKAKCGAGAARGNSTAKMRNTLESGLSSGILVRASSMQRKDIQNHG